VDLTPWRKASASVGNGACVETATTSSGAVCVRDSKNPAAGALTVTPQTWAQFTAAIKAGEYQ
jgi:Domain of unknown function (DUF397)